MIKCHFSHLRSVVYTEQVTKHTFSVFDPLVIGLSQKMLRIALFPIRANLILVTQKFEIARWDAKGTAVALVVVSLWAVSLGGLLTRPLTAWTILVGVPVQTFLYTGLFITAHDAMHGTVAPSWPRLNSFLGSLALGLYALFSFRKLRVSHSAHHSHPGEVGSDPDFNDGKHQGFWGWYGSFLLRYVGFWQIVGMALIFNIFEHVFQVAVANLLVFLVIPSLVSTIQLFYFGTYLPHRGTHINRHHARSNAYGTLVSFLTCYHFGYHLEHHEYPWVPWWHLPTARRQAINLEHLGKSKAERVLHRQSELS